MENSPIINTQNSQQSSNFPVEQNTSPRQKMNVLFLVLITSLISALIFGFGGYYWGRNNQNKLQMLPADQSLGNQTPTPLPTAQPQIKEEQPNQNTQQVVEFFTLPAGWTSSINEARTDSGCYRVVGQKIGEIEQPIKEYLVNEYNLKGIEHFDSMMSFVHQYIWEGIESYTLPGSKTDELSTIYIRPGENQWFKINIYNIGSSNVTVQDPNLSCEQEKEELQEVVKHIRFL